MNLKELRDIIQIIQEADIDELEIEREGVRIRIKKRPGESSRLSQSIPTVPVVPAPIQPSISTSVPQTPETQSVSAPVPPQAKTEGKELVSVISPMVGTFYRTPGPDADPYVELGSIVKKGQVVCIVEAMKLMNEIESEVDGKIVKILIENGQPVEYGQVLFQVEPTQNV
ncbi:acetyl-CoA carboxylase, biotin carboxyl carrier protein [Candidatus Desantisbacteria bacterium CG1_02_38_46]|uniref:Biotin carboxyl carrier protein of acetyl-CoA carboxylase n=3 Tax=unclassified Candidatus Desantisiibacteriota TaxID=3106372 RepID=A0A2H9P9S5_9BACT|nr:MAG: acetyl-CoA carboxylase, biotin carboxyl carrier protein [Candidatus Desantisbacteria bacterium CG1_02_38_46]PIU52254.1 MAG: acetyl-CoA carboxylase, biotin carboxyl carrier protein [Candidatus Desantisbacteria bacterium CG07_land_8_20_14_0_80_39_15]PIZ15054.1 MAG: acetyl-CoA carboxylase, biotin carboxyl carrier protein [Candidatus Desantisbacteria bacterium CG_4_10_14_0_8_um_filter_39_17]